MRYDKVELDHPDGTHKTLSPKEFEALPLLNRVQWISQGRLRFFKSGVKVAAFEALKPER
jgi:hypothetical protein